MPRSSNQKARLLYLAQIFDEQTDENHRLTLIQLSEKLGSMGISAERKTLYDDIEQLCTYGLPVETVRDGKSTSYYLSERIFELPELKLLADAVACSRFITEKKSQSLIKKIESLASNYQARELSRHVIVSNRVKSMNECIYYNIDIIQSAIDENRKINFCYFTYDCRKKKQYRSDKADYVFSPYALAWEDENYYCVGFYEKYNSISSFRVDKMENIRLSDQKRIINEKFSIADYSRRAFGMFSGEECFVRIKFANYFANAVIDRFGKDTLFEITDEEHFQINVRVVVSPPLFAWLFQFGTDAEIISPESVREEMQKRALEAALLHSRKDPDV